MLTSQLLQKTLTAFLVLLKSRKTLANNSKEIQYVVSNIYYCDSREERDSPSKAQCLIIETGSFRSPSGFVNAGSSIISKSPEKHWYLKLLIHHHSSYKNLPFKSNFHIKHIILNQHAPLGFFLNAANSPFLTRHNYTAAPPPAPT